jgi:hypothetical protein
MAGVSDTSPDVERLLREALRKMPFAKRWCQMGVIFRTAQMLHAAGVRSRNPHATQDEIHAEWLRARFGETSIPVLRRSTMFDSEENLRVVQAVTEVLARLDIIYAIGGSWASSLLGKMRFTHDADICVAPFPGKETDFCAGFGEDYYVSLPAVQQAVRLRRFNVLHPTSGFKVDLFVAQMRPYDLSVLARRQPHQVGPDGPSVTFVSPEDIILLKLEWYRLGGEGASMQWSDVLGVLAVQAPKLDNAYLDHWATELGLADLLARARAEAAL